jgi:TIR domain
VNWPYERRVDPAHAWGVIAVGSAGLAGIPTILATLHATDSHFQWWWPTDWMIAPAVIFLTGMTLAALPVRRAERATRAATEAGAGGEEPGAHVFICYAREDDLSVDRLQRDLEMAGISVWRDTAHLWPGEDWRLRIRRAITDDALVFIACFSSRSTARAKGYQYEELALAIDQLRMRRPDVPWLIPVRFDECPVPDIDLGGGRTLASIQHVDLFGEHRDAAVTRLLTTVRRLLTQNNQEARAHKLSDEQARREHGAHKVPYKLKWNTLISVILAISAAGSAARWWRFMPWDHSSARPLSAVAPRDHSTRPPSAVAHFSGGCAPFEALAQNRFSPYGAAIRARPDALSTKVGSYSGNKVISVDGWVHGTAEYVKNPPPWNSNVWFHLTDGSGWVSFPGVRADPTGPDPDAVSPDRGTPVPTLHSCEGTVK